MNDINPSLGPAPQWLRDNNTITGPELITKAIALSGRQNRKNKHGYGALHWLAVELDVHYNSVRRWANNGRVPQWATDRILEMEREKLSVAK